MIRLFVGHDPREAVGLHAFIQSVLEHTRVPVSITPISGKTDGTNAFTLSRFLVPYLCDYQGYAIWCDGVDMLLRADLRDLWDMRNWRYACMVVKHAYTPKHDRKYIGTELESPNETYAKKNWSSVILWNCEHYSNAGLTKSLVEVETGKYLHRFSWLRDEEIGELSAEWNWLDEYGENEKAKLCHFTNGVPAFEHYRYTPFANEWRETALHAMHGLQYDLRSER